MEPTWRVVTELTLASSKAFIFVIEEFLALLKKGHAKPRLPFLDNTTVTYTWDDATERVLGATTWSVDHERRDGLIGLSLVAEEFRGKGIYKQQMKEVNRRMHALGCITVHAFVHKDNLVMLNGIKSLGKDYDFVHTTGDLEQLVGIENRFLIPANKLPSSRPK
jgi:RimJ/RimL family protein N-acetyltransferase